MPFPSSLPATSGDFALAHAFTAQWEGGLTDHPTDPGGITNHGVSLRWVQDLARQAREECRRLARSCDGCNARSKDDCGHYALDLDMDGDVDADDIRASPGFRPLPFSKSISGMPWAARACPRPWP